MHSRRVLAALGAAALLSACAANPGPPPVVDEDDPAAQQAASSSETPLPALPGNAAKRSQASVGVDPLGAGLNPHLTANHAELVSQIARLVLPSAFHAGVMDSDLLDSAREVDAPPGTAMRVVYRIASAAQWSDGTPISGADFIYLWNGMTLTPGVDRPAGYRAISAITTSDGGRTVTVDFSQRVADWNQLFDNLLPSHLLGEESFDAALANGVPASAGRYKVESVDRARGVITLNRNDRFWGKNPAHIDILYLNQVASTEESVNMLRSGQVGFADITPRQTMREFLSLLPGVAAADVSRPRQLRLQLALDDAAARRQLAGLIDTSQVARLATGRTENLAVPDSGVEQSSDAGLLTALGRPITIATDPTDDTAARAAAVIVDQLRARGVDAEVVADKMSAITGELLPTGAVDAVLSWEDTESSALNLANAYVCSEEEPLPTAASTAPTVPTASSAASRTEEPDTQAATVTSSATDTREASASEAAAWAGNLTGYCAPHAAGIRGDILAGRISPEDAARRVEELNAEQRLWLPILDETRVHALGKGIVGPGDKIEDWAEGMATAPEWKVN